VLQNFIFVVPFCSFVKPWLLLQFQEREAALAEDGEEPVAAEGVATTGSSGKLTVAHLPLQDPTEVEEGVEETNSTTLLTILATPLYQISCAAVTVVMTLSRTPGQH